MTTPGPADPYRRVQWLIEKATRAMMYWMAKAEYNDAVYAQRSKEEGDLAEQKGSRRDGLYAWQNGIEAKLLAGEAMWMHRKVNSYSAVLRGLVARAQLLGDKSAPLPDAYSERDKNIYGIPDRLEPTLRTSRPGRRNRP